MRAANILAAFVAGRQSDTKTGHGKMQTCSLAFTCPASGETQAIKLGKQSKVRFEFTSKHLD